MNYNYYYNLFSSYFNLPSEDELDFVDTFGDHDL